MQKLKMVKYSVQKLALFVVKSLYHAFPNMREEIFYYQVKYNIELQES